MKFLRGLSRFFPFNLVFAQLRYNLVILIYWFFLFSIVNNLGTRFGLPYLFLSPEYRGYSSILAFGLLGLSIGGFIIAFHLYSYIQLGSKYPFIATLSRPFHKFCVNNSIIPVAFVLNISYRIFIFQTNEEYASIGRALFKIGALNLGIILFITFALLYFLPTNKDIYAITGKKEDDFHFETSNIDSSIHRKQAWYKSFLHNKMQKKYYYLGKNLKIRLSRSSAHYDMQMLNRVFQQNHINASVFEILLVITYISIGFFRELEIFRVPAGVSIMILLTVVLMLISALFSWFKSWTYPVIFVLLFFVNYLSVNTEWFQFKSYAFGLSYEPEEMVSYTKASLKELHLEDSIIHQQLNEYIATLDQWKQRTGEKRPKLIVLNTSGGGIRSAMWTFRVLQNLDSLTNQKFSRNLQMITGASGGMIGAAYYRDLILQDNVDEPIDRTNPRYLNNISKDLLNRLSFAFSTNDLLFRFQKVEVNGYVYAKDRGYEFEQELISNLDGALNRTLGDYIRYEKTGVIPTMIFTPTIVNDGSRLLVSAQNMGFLQRANETDKQNGIESQVENIDYLYYFKKNQTENIRFTSILRMSATFPYIMPMVTMPSDPGMQIMDAGIRDNYGSKITVRYLIALNEWIKENTGGVIVLRVRDNKKTLDGDSFYNTGMFRKALLPFGNVYGNFPRVQDFNQDELFSVASQSFDFPFKIITLNMRENFSDKISLSWHLTSLEKRKVLRAIYSKNNQAEIKELLSLLRE